MSIEQQYMRGLRRIQAQPNEVAAVKDYTPLVSGYAQSEAQRYVEGVNRGTERERMNAIMSDARRDVKAAKQDSRIALPLTVGKVGLDALGAQEIRKETDMERQRKQEEQDYWAAMDDIMKRYYNTIIERLTSEPKATYPTYPSSGLQPITSAPYAGGED